MSSDAPLTGGNGATLYARPDGNVPPIPERAAAPSHDIMPGYFRTLGIPIIAGRDFNEHDLAGQPDVMLISQAGAHKVFGNENPIGKTLLVTSASTPTEIIGVVGDVRSGKVAQPNDMEFYRPWAQENFPFMSITVRSQMKPAAVTNLVQRALNRIDPTMALAQPQSMDEIVRLALGEARLMMMLLGVFAGRGFVPRDGRHLRRSRLHRRATDRRDRCAHGARRANPRRLAPRRWPGNETGPLRFDHRPRGRARARSIDRLPALRGLGPQSVPARSNGRDPGRRGAASPVSSPPAGPAGSIPSSRCARNSR